MSSLWTPDGEHRVPRRQSPAPEAPAPDGTVGTAGAGDELTGDPLRAAADALGLDLDAMSDEDREQLREELAEMTRARREAATVPAAEVLAGYLSRWIDHVIIYLQAEPPVFTEAATMIEALRATLDGVGPRLGDNEPVLREALGQAQMIFVQVKDATTAT